MKINYTQEILLDFKYQYDKEYKRYLNFFEESTSQSLHITSNRLLTYRNIIKDFVYLIVLIRSLKNER